MPAHEASAAARDLLALLAACAPAEQGVEPKDPKDVPLVKTQPPSTCKEVGDLVGEAPNGPDAESKAKKTLREKAAQTGANYVSARRRSEIFGVCPAPGSSGGAALPPAR